MLSRMPGIMLMMALSAATFVGGPAIAEDETVVLGRVNHTPWLGLRLVQEGSEAELVNIEMLTTQVVLARQPFTVLLPTRGQDDMYQITAWTDDSIFEEARRNTQRRNNGAPVLPRFFSPGSGMADTTASSGTLMLNQEGHHHLRGLRLGPDRDQHIFFVSQVLNKDEAGQMVTIPIEEYDGSLYLVAFFDENGDESMQHGECEFIVLRFDEGIER